MLLTLALFAAAPVAAAEHRLVLFGGGDRPSGAQQRFVDWAGGKKSRIIALPWASSVPETYYAYISSGLLAHGAGSVEMCASTWTRSDWADAFRAQLSSATGVFIIGGDQSQFMATVEAGGLLGDLRKAYDSGVAFAGTSAGTAVMSRVMLTGEGDPEVIDGSTVGVRGGLGLLPGVITDQHFIARQRENRLFGLMLLHRDLLGVGVDEAAALAVRGDRFAEAFGIVPTDMVMIVQPDAKVERLVVDLLRPGQRYDLRLRRRL